MHMISHGSGHAYATRRAFSLEPCHYINCVTVEIGPICNGVANVDPDPKTNGAVRRLFCIDNRNLLLHFHGAAHRTVYAVEHDQEGVASRLDDPPTVLLNRRVD